MTTITASAAAAARPSTPPNHSTMTAPAVNNTPKRSGFAASPGRVRTRGFFDEGVWKCNCQPRRPAVHFETRNGGKNHGRWFYTCQESPPRRCDFFLWDDEAKLREKKAVLNNSRTEPGSSQAQQPQPQASQRPQYQQTRLPQLQQTQLQLQDNQLLQQTQQSQRQRNGPSSPRQHRSHQDTHNDIDVASKPNMPQQGAAALSDGQQTPPGQYYSWPSSDVDDTQDLNELANNSFDSEIGHVNPHRGHQPQPTTPRKRQRGDLDNKDDDGYSYRPVPGDRLPGQTEADTRFDRAGSPTLQGNRHDARPAAVKREPNEDQAQASISPGITKSGSYHSAGTLIPPNTGIATPEITPANPNRTYDPLGRQSVQNPSYLAAPPSTPAVSAANLRAPNLQQQLSQQQQQQQQLQTPGTPQGSSACTHLERDVFGLLRTSGITLPQDTREALSELCKRYVLLAYGMEKGRESVRAAVRDRDATIAELRERNDALEEDIKALKRVRKSEGAGSGAGVGSGAGSLASTSYNPSRMYTAAEAQRQQGRQQERGSQPAMRASMTSGVTRLQAGMFSNISPEVGSREDAGRDSSTSLTDSESEED